MNDETGGKRDLREELRKPRAAAWKPEVGDELVGVLDSYGEGHAQHGPMIVANVCDETTGELFAVWLGAVLLDEFKQQRPRPGERVGLRREPDGGDERNSYRRFRVVVDRERAVIPDFEAFERK